MKRFQLTSSKYKGTVEVVYNGEGLLHRIDFAQAILQPNQIVAVKNCIAEKVDGAYKISESLPITVTEAEFEVTFDDFKREYPRKRNTHLAEKYFPKLTSGKQYQAFVAAIEYKKYCVRKGLKQEFIMLPERFLKEEQWKNDWRNEGL